jgi:hypothetical protein
MKFCGAQWSGAGDDNFQRAGLGCSDEHVVGIVELVHGEVVGDELIDDESIACEKLQQGWRTRCVHKPGGDRDVASPQVFEMQRHRLTVNTDVGDVTTGSREAGAKLESWLGYLFPGLAAWAVVHDGFHDAADTTP